MEHCQTESDLLQFLEILWVVLILFSAEELLVGQFTRAVTTKHVGLQADGGLIGHFNPTLKHR